MNHPECPIAVVMAAGKSTRMKSQTPKVLHTVAGRSVIDYVLQAGIDGCGIDEFVVVVGHKADRVQSYLTERWGNAVRFALQDPQLGTGHAVQQAEALLKDFDGDVLTLAGDTPLVTADILRRLYTAHRKSGAAATMLTARMDDPAMYGRVIRAKDGSVLRIVEARDAGEEERKVDEINASIYCFRAPLLFEALRKVRPVNNQGEYYLTDVISVLVEKGERVEAVTSPDPNVVMGVNTRAEMARAAALIRTSVLEKLMDSGVTVMDPANTYIDITVEIGQDTIIYPGTVIEGETKIGARCVLGPHSYIRDSEFADDVSFMMSRAWQARVDKGVSVGPFANLRPEAIVGADSIIGSFVELKKSVLGQETHVCHLTYIGDAFVGDRANVGGGTITCNFDGERKHQTFIGPDTFIGSNNTLVAPVSVGEGAYTAAGSTITENVPTDALGVARERQVNKEGWAAARRKAKRKQP